MSGGWYRSLPLGTWRWRGVSVACRTADGIRLRPPEHLRLPAGYCGALPSTWSRCPLLFRWDPEEYDVKNGRDAAWGGEESMATVPRNQKFVMGGMVVLAALIFALDIASAPGLDAGATLRRRGRGQSVAGRTPAHMDCRHRMHAADRPGLLRRSAWLDQRRSVQP